MIQWQRLIVGLNALGILAASVFLAVQGVEAEKPVDNRRIGVYVELTESFYRALSQGQEGSKTYTTGQSDEYLRQIAVSTRYMVETNLQVLQQQERLIDLLEAMAERNAKGP